MQLETRHFLDGRLVTGYCFLYFLWVHIEEFVFSQLVIKKIETAGLWVKMGGSCYVNRHPVHEWLIFFTCLKYKQ